MGGGLLTLPFGILVITVKVASPQENVLVGEIFQGSIPLWIYLLVVVVAIIILLGSPRGFPILVKFEGTGMPAYWVARARINDPVEYKKYADRVPDIIARHGGKALARGGKFKILEGSDAFQRFVVIEFASLAAAEECYNSAEYQEASAFRKGGAGQVEIIIVEGVATT